MGFIDTINDKIFAIRATPEGALLRDHARTLTTSLATVRKGFVASYSYYAIDESDVPSMPKTLVALRDLENSILSKAQVQNLKTETVSTFLSSVKVNFMETVLEDKVNGKSAGPLIAAWETKNYIPLQQLRQGLGLDQDPLFTDDKIRSATEKKVIIAYGNLKGTLKNSANGGNETFRYSEAAILLRSVRAAGLVQDEGLENFLQEKRELYIQRRVNECKTDIAADVQKGFWKQIPTKLEYLANNLKDADTTPEEQNIDVQAWEKKYRGAAMVVRVGIMLDNLSRATDRDTLISGLQVANNIRIIIKREATHYQSKLDKLQPTANRLNVATADYFGDHVPRVELAKKPPAAPTAAPPGAEP